MEGEHNWIEFTGRVTKKRVIIDPWPSGEREIYSKEPYKKREGDSDVKSYPDYRNLPIVIKKQ